MLNFVVAASDISIGEALGNMVVGLGVVFAALLFLCGIISLFKFISKWDKSAAKAPAKAPVKAAAAAPVVKAAPKEEGIDGAVLAVILAAVAEKCGPNARITSIQKSK